MFSTKISLKNFRQSIWKEKLKTNKVENFWGKYLKIQIKYLQNEGCSVFEPFDFSYFIFPISNQKKYSSK